MQLSHLLYDIQQGLQKTLALTTCPNNVYRLFKWQRCTGGAFIEVMSILTSIHVPFKDCKAAGQLLAVCPFSLNHQDQASREQSPGHVTKLVQMSLHGTQTQAGWLHWVSSKAPQQGFGG